MTKKDLEYFKAKLLKEKGLLEDELKTIAHKNPDRPGDWEASPVDMDIDSADENEVADKFEEYEEHQVVLEQLEKQLAEVNAALGRITNGTYGICELSGDKIEPERLEANPSARTSMKHMNDNKKVQH